VKVSAGGLAIALAVAGCGASSALTTPVLRDRAADACSAATAREQKIADPATPAATQLFLMHGIAVVKRESAALSDLDAGDAAAPVFRRAVQALDGELAQLQKAETLLRGGAEPIPTFRTLQTSLATLEQQTNAAWNKLQIPACLTAS
jgi:hypothetical protein